MQPVPVPLEMESGKGEDRFYDTGKVVILKLCIEKEFLCLLPLFFLFTTGNWKIMDEETIETREKRIFKTTFCCKIAFEAIQFNCKIILPYFFI